jgi:hypothetical protein
MRRRKAGNLGKAFESNNLYRDGISVLNYEQKNLTNGKIGI